MTSSRSEGQAEKTLCLVAVTIYVESTSGCYLTPLTSLPRALSISISCGQEKAGDYKYSFLSLLFCFVSILWDRVSYYLGGLKCTAELKLALIPEPPISLCEFWDYRHGPTYPGTNSLPPLSMFVYSGARLFWRPAVYIECLSQSISSSFFETGSHTVPRLQ